MVLRALIWIARRVFYNIKIVFINSADKEHFNSAAVNINGRRLLN